MFRSLYENMSESTSVDDMWSFERVAQLRRMTDVQPAVLSQFKALGPNDLLPVQFQFSRRRTNLINSIVNLASDEEEDFAGDEHQSQQSKGSNGKSRSDSQQPSEQELKEQQSKQPKIDDDQRSLVSNMSDVSIDGVTRSVRRVRNMRAAPRTRTPTSLRSSRAASRIESPSAVSGGVTPSLAADLEWRNKQHLLAQLFVQRLEMQEKLLASLQRSDGSGPSGDFQRYGDADNRRRERRGSLDKFTSSSRQSVGRTGRKHRHARHGSVDSAPNLPDSDSRYNSRGSMRRHRPAEKNVNQIKKQ